VEFCVIGICHGELQNCIGFQLQFRLIYTGKKFQYQWLIQCKFNISRYQQNEFNFLSVNLADYSALVSCKSYFNMPIVTEIKIS
jgi:hypothetical protein